MSAETVTDYATLVRADNPGPMTLEGTNTWILRAPDSGAVVVVDPGPLLMDHLQSVLDTIQAFGCSVEVVLLTHGHPDHSDGADWFAEQAGCQVRSAADRPASADPAPAGSAPDRLTSAGPATAGSAPDRLTSAGPSATGPASAGPASDGPAAGRLVDGELITAGDLQVEVITTPGHTADSVCFWLPQDDTLLTGDTVLGRGTSVVAYPDGALGPYLDSLAKLEMFVATSGVERLLPGHGPVIDDPVGVLAFYRRHRQERLAQVRAAVEAGATTPQEVVQRVYADIDPILWPAAEHSVRAQLDYLTP